LQTSVFLAKLIGPFALLLGLAMLINRAHFVALSKEFMASPALIFLSGVITFPAGLAIVLTHNRWAMAWPLLITLLGWLALIAGVVRIVCPAPAAAFGQRIINHRLTLPIAAAIYIGIGALLCFYGYYRR
jgi:uncharacterized membrane protein HdeD (DUF308 family)